MHNAAIVFLVFCLALIVFSFGFSCGVNIGEKNTIQKFERNAVKSGAAVWVPDKDTGEPVIRWVNTPLSKEAIEGK